MNQPATTQKRQQLRGFIEVALAPHNCVQGVVGVGSIASGLVRPDSDIDAVVFFDPLDLYIVPAEFIWLPVQQTFHSIFSDDPVVHETGIQFDFSRYDMAQWRAPDHVWPEAVCHGLNQGWIAFDRNGEITQLIQERTTYQDEFRTNRLDKAIVELDLGLTRSNPQELWKRVGSAQALDRLQAIYDTLVAALFAYNRQWRPHRSREMSHLLALPWLPHDFMQRILPALNAPSLLWNGYLERFQALESLFTDLKAQLVRDGEYSQPSLYAYARRARARLEHGGLGPRASSP